MTHVIRIGRRYFSARRGLGGCVGIEQATLFTERDARDFAGRIAGAVVEAV